MMNLDIKKNYNMAVEIAAELSETEVKELYKVLYKRFDKKVVDDFTLSVNLKKIELLLKNLRK